MGVQHFRGIGMDLGSSARESKVVILGSTLVGKTSIVSRLATNSFSPATTPTVGTALLGHTVKVGELEVKLQLWDTGGSEKYRSMVPMYFQHADAAVIVYDITSRESFNDVTFWLKELRDKGPDSIVIALAGNKCDLEQMRAVPKEHGQNFATQNEIPIFRETSAVTDENVHEIFEEAARGIVDRTALTPPARPRALVGRGPDEESACC
jgi:small GTP-binding protein